MNVWLIPARYIAVSGLAGFILPRFEDAYLDRVHAMSVGVAIAFFSVRRQGKPIHRRHQEPSHPA